MSDGSIAEAGAVRVTSSFLWGLAVVSLLGAGLRLYDLDGGSLFVDEIRSVQATTRLDTPRPAKSFGFVATAVGLLAVGVNPADVPADDIGQWRQMGLDHWKIRLSSCIIGILSIPILTLASRRLLGTRGAIILGFLLAVAPWHIYWSQLGRYYTQQFLFYNLALIWYFDATRRQRRGLFIAAMVCVVLGFMTQPPGLMVVGVFALDWLIGLLRREPVRLGAFGWIAALVTLAVCGGILAADILWRPQSWEVVVTATAQRPTLIVADSAFRVHLVVGLVAVLSAWMLSRRDRRLGVYLSIAAVLPLVVITAVAVMEMWAHSRYVFVSLFAWLLLAAVGLDQVYGLARDRFGRLFAAAPTIAVIAAVMLTNAAYFTTGNHLDKRWRDAFEFVDARWQKGEVIMTSCNSAVAQYYLGHLPDVRIEEKVFGSLDVVVDKAQGNPVWIVELGGSTIKTNRRAWIFQNMQLMDIFPLHVWQPYSAIEVYKYPPPGRPPPIRMVGEDR